MMKTIDTWLLVLLLVAFGSTSIPANVVLTDTAFIPSNYTQTPTFNTTGASIAGSQCVACGNPGSALQVVAVLTQGGTAALGFVNNTLSYAPLVQGQVNAINAIVDKYLNIDQSGSFFNTFRPLIRQNGRYYMARIPAPNFSGGSTGFITLSKSGLLASDFVEYDFSIGQFLSGNPDFDGSEMSFGIGQISGLDLPNTTITAIYDNLIIQVEAADTLLGDFNHDGTVDAADYVVWRNGLGTTYTQDDFNIWRGNFGALSPGAAAVGHSPLQSPVPEPRAIILGAITVMFFISKHLNRRRESN